MAFRWCRARRSWWRDERPHSVHCRFGARHRACRSLEPSVAQALGGRSPRRNGNGNGSDKRNPFISSAQPAQGMTSNTTKSSNVSTHCLFGKTGLPMPKALSHPTSHRQAHAAMDVQPATDCSETIPPPYLQTMGTSRGADHETHGMPHLTSAHQTGPRPLGYQHGIPRTIETQRKQRSVPIRSATFLFVTTCNHTSHDILRSSHPSETFGPTWAPKGKP